MTYAEKVGRWRRVFAIDADGFDLRAIGPDNATAISPAFGPGAQHLLRALERLLAVPPRAAGRTRRPCRVNVPGSIMGLAFNADHTKMALTVMDSGQSRSGSGPRDRLQPMPDAALRRTTRSSGRCDKVAYVAGTPGAAHLRRRQGRLAAGLHGQRAGLLRHAAGPARRLHRRRRLGRGHHRDRHERRGRPAPDPARGREHLRRVQPGRPPRRLLLDRQAQGRGGSAATTTGAGLFIMPIQRPWLAKKISSEVGESLRWEASRPSLRSRGPDEPSGSSCATCDPASLASACRHRRAERPRRSPRATDGAEATPATEPLAVVAASEARGSSEPGRSADLDAAVPGARPRRCRSARAGRTSRRPPR